MTRNGLFVCSWDSLEVSLENKKLLGLHTGSGSGLTPGHSCVEFAVFSMSLHGCSTFLTQFKGISVKSSGNSML